MKEIKSFERVALNSAALSQPRIKTRLDMGNDYLKNTRRQAMLGKLPSRELTADMGW